MANRKNDVVRKNQYSTRLVTTQLPTPLEQDGIGRHAHISNNSNNAPQIQLKPSGDLVMFEHAIPVNPTLVLETTAQGNHSTIIDFHIKAKKEKNGNISSIDLGSNLDSSHKLTLESTNTTDDKGSSISASISTNLLYPLTIGDCSLSTSYRLGQRTTFFSRLFRDAVLGQQLVVQSCYQYKRDKLVSVLGAVNFGFDLGAGISVTKLFFNENDRKRSHDFLQADSIEIRALGATSGDHTLSIMANFGDTKNM